MQFNVSSSAEANLPYLPVRGPKLGISRCMMYIVLHENDYTLLVSRLSLPDGRPVLCVVTRKDGRGSQIVKVSIWDDPGDGGRLPPWEQLTKNQEKWKETMQVGKGGGRGSNSDGSEMFKEAIKVRV